MDKITVYVHELDGFCDCEPGMTLRQIADKTCKKRPFPVLAAYVDNKLKELGYKIYSPHMIRFIDYTDPNGRRTYIRTLSFVLQKAARELFPKQTLFLDYNLPNGLYGEIRAKGSNSNSLKPVKVSMDDVVRLKRKMQSIIDSDIPIVREKMMNEEAVSLYRENGQMEKAMLTKNMDKYFVSVYKMDDYCDTFYGPLLESTGEITIFDLIPYSDGFCIQSPSSAAPDRITEYKYQDRLSSVFKENSDWCGIIGAHGITSVNQTIRNGESKHMIAIAESLHERKFVKIADMIYARRRKIKLVLIAGPSSSGKTTTSKRIALQCKVLGLNPLVVAMDDYFLDRDKTPRDADGNYDFESVNALDLNLFSTQLNALFAGEEVELPKYNFLDGKQTPSGNKIRLGDNDILIMEGIHALNPKLTEHIGAERIFKVFASALTSLSIDENNCISTTDNRMLRRMVRDNLTRGISPEETILRWPQVRKGEEENIFPFQENADVMFNSSLLFELPMLKYYAQPFLERIPITSEAYSESVRFLKFLSYVEALAPDEISSIPPTSIMREFIGGSTFEY